MTERQRAQERYELELRQIARSKPSRKLLDVFEMVDVARRERDVARQALAAAEAREAAAKGLYDAVTAIIPKLPDYHTYTISTILRDALADYRAATETDGTAASARGGGAQG